MTIGLSLLAVILAYLIGSIPVAYLVVYAVRRVDIRTVGSGNVGATNAGRVLGRPYFWVVFVPDLLKGFLPTWGFPRLVAWISGTPVPSLGVFVAVAAIVGHNFPVYLGFKGGKGVAASLGAVFALDPVAGAAAALAFVVFLLAMRMVSMASLLGAVVFVFAHFIQVKDPFRHDHAAMSIATVLLLVLLVVRHRANLARIAKGTEPKISFVRKKSPPSGSARLSLCVGLLAASALAGWVVTSAQPAESQCGPLRLRLIDRAQTGHQRSEDVRFFDQGRRLAVSCPRYDRVVLYDTSSRSLRKVRDLHLDGKPVSIRATTSRLYVLQRPSHDARHLVPGFWRVYDFNGEPIGPRFNVGYDPDDLLLLEGGQVALVLTSGHAEGETNRPDPALKAYDLSNPASPRLVSTVVFRQKGDNPERLVLSKNATHAAVVLTGSDRIVSLHLADPRHPRVVGSMTLATRPYPYLSRSDTDAILMPVDTDRRVVPLGSVGLAERGDDRAEKIDPPAN
jgi:glycerol-3-phosphate acyltransferase PlsY